MPDPTSAPLPPTSPAGGPGFAPPGSDPTAGLPTWGGMMQGAALAAPPAFDPNAPSMVGKMAVPAGGARQPAIEAVDTTAAGLPQWMDQSNATHHFNSRLGQLQSGPGVAERFLNWTGIAGGNAQTTAALDQRQQAADVYSSDAGKKYFTQHPDQLTFAERDPVGFAMKVGPMLEAHANAGTAQPETLVHGNGMVKTNTNPALTKAVADAHGMALGAAHAITEPHQYSWPEFQAATRGMTNRQAAQAWEMQHYLNPQQQAVASYLSGLTNQANASHPDGGAAKDGGAADKQLQQVLHMITTGMPAQ